MKLISRKREQELLAAVWQAGRESDTPTNPYVEHVHQPVTRTDKDGRVFARVSGVTTGHQRIYRCECNHRIVARLGHPNVWKVFR